MSLAWACLLAVLGWSGPALAQSGAVQVSCPPLTAEQAAEIEARVRATLLTAEMPATVLVTCESDQASVEVTSSTGQSARETLATSPNLREELLAALDRAFEQLAGPKTNSSAPGGASDGGQTEGGTPPAAGVQASPPAPPPPPLPAAPAAPTPTPTPTPTSTPTPTPTQRGREQSPPEHRSRAASAPVFAECAGELWSSRPALGAELGSEWALTGLRYGVRAGVLTPLNADPTFTLVEWEGLASLSARPEALAGFQLTLALGLGWMVVSPRGAARSSKSTSVGAPFVLIALSRALRFGHFALAPELGARLFASERGVRVDQNERARLGWVVPRLALGIAYLD